MIKIKMLSTGEIREVTPNVAFGLIDSKQAVRADLPNAYANRKMTASESAEMAVPTAREEEPVKQSNRKFTYKRK